MKVSQLLFFPTVFCLCLGAFSFAADAPDSDRSCYLQAPDQDDVYVTVYNEDGEGNRTDMIWQGTIPAGQQQLITSDGGRLRYDVSFSADRPAGGDNSVGCDGLKSIGMMP